MKEKETNGLAKRAGPTLLGCEGNGSGAESREGFSEEVRGGLGLEN